MAHLLVIGKTAAVHPKAKALGARLTLMVPTRSLKGAPLELYDRIVTLPRSASLEEWIDTARHVARHDPFDGIGGFSEVNQHYAAVIGEALGLRYPSPECIRATRDKARMREVLREAGVEDTPCATIESPEELGSFGEHHGYPVVLKPLDGRGSLGISIVRSPSDIPGAFAWFRAWAADHPMLVERFLPGEEWSVEAFSERGEHRVVCVTQKFKDPVTSVEIGHCLPAPIEPSLRASIASAVERVLDAIGLEDGPSHTELIVTPEGPRIVETHARTAGDKIVELIRLVSGADLNELWMRQQLGERVLDRLPSQFDGYASVSFVTPRAVGTLERVEGVEAARAAPGVTDVVLEQSPGAALAGAHDSASRGALVIAVAATADEAVTRARTGSSHLRFIVSCAG